MMKRSPDSTDVTRMFTAVSEGDINTMQDILNTVDEDFHIYRTYRGFTALHVAAEKGDVMAIVLLLKHGADINDRTNFGYTALHVASEKGHILAMELLLKLGADIHAGTNYMYTALHKACEKGRLAAVQLLINNGSNVHAVTKDGCTAVLLAAVNGHAIAIDMLIEHGFHLDITKKFEYTALHAASSSGHVSVIEILLNYGMDVNAVDENGCSPIILACWNVRFDAVKFLASKGGRMTEKSYEGYTALTYVGGEYQDLADYLSNIIR